MSRWCTFLLLLALLPLAACSAIGQHEVVLEANSLTWDVSGSITVTAVPPTLAPVASTDPADVEGS